MGEPCSHHGDKARMGHHRGGTIPASLGALHRAGSQQMAFLGLLQSAKELPRERSQADPLLKSQGRLPRGGEEAPKSWNNLKASEFKNAAGWTQWVSRGNCRLWWLFKTTGRSLRCSYLLCQVLAVAWVDVAVSQQHNKTQQAVHRSASSPGEPQMMSISTTPSKTAEREIHP